MISEQFARKFRPAGFSADDAPERRAHKQPENELAKRYVQWMQEIPDDFNIFSICSDETEAQYQKAVGFIQDLEPNIDETNALLVVDYGKEFEEAYRASGIFVSAIWNRVNPDFLVFDIDAEDVDCLGYKFGGRLVNNGKVRNGFGYGSKGPVVNNGEAGNEFGYGSKGPVVNNGKAGGGFGRYSTGPVVNNGEAGYLFGQYSKGPVVAIIGPERYGDLPIAIRVLKPKDCAKIPELKQYIGKIGERTKALKDAKPEDVERLLEGLDARTIEQEIYRLIGGSQ